ncbi:glycoside hydrolase family 3 C-terminal domain-containing protein [candidate division KSB1 bacterium]|nr:glycoside hydrolase family 3 C-terminal domain-containing protein [candidate division KSB1 bacterium]
MKHGLIGILAFLFLFIPLFLTAQSSLEAPAYKDVNLPIEKRVDDLVSRMTLEEKVSQLVHSAAGVERLGIPPYNWWNECLHGVARAGVATVFPQAIGLAATWNKELMYRVADIISTEARAKHHEFVRNGEFDIYKGLTFWSPNINIFRDPRWGRGQETYGEDPYLTARMGVQFVKGLQGNDPNYLKVVSTPKHFAVHSGPEPDRHGFDAVTDVRDLYSTYLPAFEATVREANAYSVMCAYNRYLGEACCGHSLLLKKILRDDWGFKGYIVSDCGAISDMYRHHKVANTAPEAAALGVKSGTDLNCGMVYHSLNEAVDLGLLSEADIDVALTRLMDARFRLGMFDPLEMVPYAQIPITMNDTPEHRAVSLEAARESIVLLKNDNNMLPLKKDLSQIAVIGPTADSYDIIIGNYNGTPSKYVTPLQGIKDKVAPNTNVVYSKGCNLALEGPLLTLVPSEVLSSDGENGLKAEYYDNRNLEGEPFFTRIEKQIDSNWRSGETIPGFVNRNFSVRWTGNLTPPQSGDYVFALSGDDGFRMFLNDKLLIEDWTMHSSLTQSATVRLESGRAYALKIEYFQRFGNSDIKFEWAPPFADETGKVLDLAESSDVVIFVGGISPRLEGEEMRVDYEGFAGGDRNSIDLPESQRTLLKRIYETGKPIVLVLTSGSALSVNWAQENLPAIIQLWYPGQEGGMALADVLFGEYNPAGRLPVTFYKSVDQLPPFDDYNMQGKTYRYFDGEPLYPFGYGLSYATFEYSELSVPSVVDAGDSVVVSALVKNSSEIAGDEVVQLYVKDLETSVPVPIRELQGFKRIYLSPGESRTVEFLLTPRQLSLIDDLNRRLVEPGTFQIAVGGIMPGFNAASTGYVLGEFEVQGEPIVIEQY